MKKFRDVKCQDAKKTRDANFRDAKVPWPFKHIRTYVNTEQIDARIEAYNWFRSLLQSVTKKHVPPVFQLYVIPGYLLNRLSYKKDIYIFLYQFLKSFQLELEFFKSDDKIR